LVLAGLLPEAIRSRNGETTLILKPILEEKSDIARAIRAAPRRGENLLQRGAVLIARLFCFFVPPLGGASGGAASLDVESKIKLLFQNPRCFLIARVARLVARA